MDENDAYLNERELVEKLAIKWHLSVPERRMLPSGCVRGSVLMEIIEEKIVKVLKNESFYPRHVEPEETFNGGVIEHKQNDSYAVYWHTEISLYRFGIYKTDHYSTFAETCTAYTKQTYGNDIDGVPIDWKH